MSKSKMDKEVLSYLVEIKEDVAGIKEHLKTLNGKVIDHRSRIICLEDQSLANRINWAKLSGVVFGVSLISSIIGNKLLSLFWGG